ncbi:MAG: hypothetical protein GY765_16350 [bacterium]|nr:hypothetical protein [bacterium]
MDKKQKNKKYLKKLMKKAQDAINLVIGSTDTSSDEDAGGDLVFDASTMMKINVTFDKEFLPKEKAVKLNLRGSRFFNEIKRNIREINSIYIVFPREYEFQLDSHRDEWENRLINELNGEYDLTLKRIYFVGEEEVCRIYQRKGITEIHNPYNLQKGELLVIAGGFINFDKNSVPLSSVEAHVSVHTSDETEEPAGPKTSRKIYKENYYGRYEADAGTYFYVGGEWFHNLFIPDMYHEDEPRYFSFRIADDGKTLKFFGDVHQRGVDIRSEEKVVPADDMEKLVYTISPVYLDNPQIHHFKLSILYEHETHHQEEQWGHTTVGTEHRLTQEEHKNSPAPQKQAEPRMEAELHNGEAEPPNSGEDFDPRGNTPLEVPVPKTIVSLLASHDDDTRIAVSSPDTGGDTPLPHTADHDQEGNHGDSPIENNLMAEPGDRKSKERKKRKNDDPKADVVRRPIEESAPYQKENLPYLEKTMILLPSPRDEDIPSYIMTIGDEPKSIKFFTSSIDKEVSILSPDKQEDIYKFSLKDSIDYTRKLRNVDYSISNSFLSRLHDDVLKMYFAWTLKSNPAEKIFLESAFYIIGREPLDNLGNQPDGTNKYRELLRLNAADDDFWRIGTSRDHAFLMRSREGYRVYNISLNYPVYLIKSGDLENTVIRPARLEPVMGDEWEEKLERFLCAVGDIVTGHREHRELSDLAVQLEEYARSAPIEADDTVIIGNRMFKYGEPLVMESPLSDRARKSILRKIHANRSILRK